MIIKGQKRKLPPEAAEHEGGTSPTWESQRQFVFSVSLHKYQRCQELPEPSLRRSVLIANTLRQVSLEACATDSAEDETSQPCSPALQAKEQERVLTAAKHHSAVASSSVALGNGSQVSPNAAQLSHCAGFGSSASNVPLPAQDEDEDWGSMSTEFDVSLSSAVASILAALDSTIDGNPPAATRTPLRSLENLSGLAEGSVAGVKQGVRVNGSGWEQQAECETQETSMELMRSSYLGDITVEDLFQDIDTSLVERDMGVLGLKGSESGYPAEDELLWYLPPFFPSSSSSSCLPAFSTFTTSPSSAFLPSPSFSGHSHVKEALELEHLMEVLVES